MISNQKSQTKHLVQDYIAWRLAKAGYHNWHRANKIKENTQTTLYTAMRNLAYKFEKVYEAKFSSDDQQLEITSFNCKDTISGLISELFELKGVDHVEIQDNRVGGGEEDKVGFNCNWASIIGLFAFVGKLGVQCFDEQSVDLVYTLIDMQVEFLNGDKRISGWIESQGSWVSL